MIGLGMGLQVWGCTKHSCKGSQTEEAPLGADVSVRPNSHYHLDGPGAIVFS